MAGDSDFVPLAQSCKQLSRYVVGIGVAGSTSRALASACSESIDYAHLPGVTPLPSVTKESARMRKAAARATKAGTTRSADATATDLLLRAIRVSVEKSDDDWGFATGLKSQMHRMDPAFKEKSLGFSSFPAFVESRTEHVESKVADDGQLTVRLH